MPGQSSATATPPSTHASVHVLVAPDALPRVSANLVTGPEVGGGETVFLHVEAEHRSLDFDHTATFTVSGPRRAVDRLLVRLRAAFSSLPHDEPDEEARG